MINWRDERDYSQVGAWYLWFVLSASVNVGRILESWSCSNNFSVRAWHNIKVVFIKFKDCGLSEVKSQ